MREPKYKFWDREEKRMIGPNLDSERYYIGSYNGLALFDTERKDEDGYTYQMDVEFLQYTGLKDRNGKEIYEGDVIPPDYALRQNEVAIICYDSNQARFKAVPLSLYKANAGNGGWTGFEVTRHGSIIGNIYENPSLLEDTP